MKKYLIFAIILVSSLLLVSMTQGKYIYNSVWNYYLKSKGFYFESDLLEVNTKNNSILKWDGSNVEFEIKNSLNSELVSDYDITYKTTCSVLGDEAKYIDCVLNDTEQSVFNGSLSTNTFCINEIDDTDVSKYTKTECEINGYTWYKEITNKKLYFNLVLKDQTKEIDEVSVKIISESITPYHKTLTGIFNLNKVDVMESEYEIGYESYAEYDEVSIINKTSENKCFVIEFSPTDYLFDINTKDIIKYNKDFNNKINEIELKIEKNSSFSYEFYKLKIDGEYSIDKFSITEKDC